MEARVQDLDATHRCKLEEGVETRALEIDLNSVAGGPEGEHRFVLKSYRRSRGVARFGAVTAAEHEPDPHALLTEPGELDFGLLRVVAETAPFADRLQITSGKKSA